jgi:hypothetical protein
VRSSLESASPDFRFALAVASTADILRHSPSAQGWSLVTARKLAERTAEGQAERAEFVKLVTQAQALMPRTADRLPAGVQHCVEEPSSPQGARWSPGVLIRIVERRGGVARGVVAEKEHLVRGQ